MQLTLIGHIALNINTVLFTVLYLPQLWRNRSQAHFSHMSFAFHGILFLAVTADLYYAFGRIEQWQYQAVGVEMFALLAIQHIQWWAQLKRLKRTRQHHLVSLAAVVLLAGLLILPHHFEDVSLYIAMGWLARAGYWSYSIPQIIKNHLQQSSRAISPIFLSLCLCVHVLDCTAAWIFHWGSPSLYGAPIGFTLHGILMYQYFHYGHHTVARQSP